MTIKTINILGSTGSIGTQTIDIILQYREHFNINILSAFNNYELVAKQIRLLSPKIVFINDEHVETLKSLMSSLASNQCLIYGYSRMQHIIENSEKTDITMLAVDGFAGLRIGAIIAPYTKIMLLANKEAIVCGGEIFLSQLKKSGCSYIPVDSEHNTIFQLLNFKYGDLDNAPNPNSNNIKQIIITASGGPFRTHTKDQLHDVTYAQAARHPKWDMGSAISINSSTLMNKALEIIEAHYLFNTKNIKAIIHPSVIVHAIIELENGMSIMGCANPDMHLHIANALFHNWFEHYDACKLYDPYINWSSIGHLEFYEINPGQFPFVQIAYQIINMDSYNDKIKAAIVMNAANELALKLFKNSQIKYTAIVDFVMRAIDRFANDHVNIYTIEDIIMYDKKIRSDTINL